ncbi:DUF1376 domain-containing protein [Devosia sp. Root635]|uniref:DUF1376 domain-containing protein n=1 Tax=Devosia sp. Root635 TaxID=1736575 RepID=UPI000701A75B|nr:DUF1376 domain-containing protein [Devosia sp. Root635]KRA42054.1 hypothetical protein ASD80_10025 [Devosia sp. Root635]
MTSSQPWVRLFPGEWLATTRGMTAAETGVLITLRCMMFERQGPIPRDDARHARLCGMPAGTFKRILASLIAEEMVSADGDNLWSGEVETELSHRHKITNAAREKANTRWTGKGKKINAGDDAVAMQAHSDSIANQNQNITPIGPEGHEHAIDLAGMSRNIRDYAAMGISRDAALAVQCQQCGAEAGAGCAGVRGQGRDAPHIERYQLVAKLREAAKSETATLPIVREGDPLVPFLAKVRGREIIFGTRGTVTATTAELEAAKALAGAA